MKILQIFILTTTKTNYALENAKGHMQSMVEDFKKDKHFFDIKDFDSQDELRENVLNSALSIQFRSGWETHYENFKAKEFEILLSWGGPALRVIGEITDYGSKNPKIQFQDWGTPWTDFEITEDQQDALNWFCNCFYFGG